MPEESWKWMWMGGHKTLWWWINLLIMKRPMYSPCHLNPDAPSNLLKKRNKQRMSTRCQLWQVDKNWNSMSLPLAYQQWYPTLIYSVTVYVQRSYSNPTMNYVIPWSDQGNETKLLLNSKIRSKWMGKCSGDAETSKATFTTHTPSDDRRSVVFKDYTG